MSLTILTHLSFAAAAPSGIFQTEIPVDKCVTALTYNQTIKAKHITHFLGNPICVASNT